MQFFFLREAWRSFTAHRGLALTAIFSMTAALIVGTTRPDVAEAVGGRRLLLGEGRLREVVPAGAPVTDFTGPFGAAPAGPAPGGA